MRKKTWKVAAAVMVAGSMFQVGCLTNRQINAFTSDIFGALTTGLVSFISEDVDFGAIIPL